MTMGIMPVTGIPLPFMSYGGSSMIASFACVGLVANVSHAAIPSCTRSTASAEVGDADSTPFGWSG